MGTGEHVPTNILLPPLVASQHLDQPTFHERYEAMPPETRSELVGGVVYKQADYERVGVREYVVVEWEPDRVHWFIHGRKRFQALRPGRDGIYRSEAFPGLWLNAEALYAEDLPRLMEILDQGLATPEHADFAAKLAAAQTRTKGAN
jgi:Putative restriction endonuclease